MLKFMLTLFLKQKIIELSRNYLNNLKASKAEKRAKNYDEMFSR